MGEMGEGTEPFWRAIHSKASCSVGAVVIAGLPPKAVGMNAGNSWSGVGVSFPSLDSGVPLSSRSFDRIFFSAPRAEDDAPVFRPFEVAPSADEPDGASTPAGQNPVLRRNSSTRPSRRVPVALSI